jgi:TatD DNase family protein
MLIDSHCHLADPAYDPDRSVVLERAWAAGVRWVVVIGESRAAGEWDGAAEQWLRSIVRDPRVVAVGETGLDYHYDHAPRQAQRFAFESQLVIAAACGKPAVIHAREADDDVAGILADHTKVTVIFHSFSSGMGLLRAGLVHRHYVSFSGMVTFKNWRLDDAIRETPLDRLLIETDGPYLAPVPHRGKRNEPAFVRHVAERIAAVRGLPVDELIARIGDNARRVFQLQSESGVGSQEPAPQTPTFDS